MLLHVFLFTSLWEDREEEGHSPELIQGKKLAWQGKNGAGLAEHVPPRAFGCRYTHTGRQMLTWCCPVGSMSNPTGLAKVTSPVISVWRIKCPQTNKFGRQLMWNLRQRKFNQQKLLGKSILQSQAHSSYTSYH